MFFPIGIKWAIEINDVIFVFSRPVWCHAWHHSSCRSECNDGVNVQHLRCSKVAECPWNPAKNRHCLLWKEHDCPWKTSSPKACSHSIGGVLYMALTIWKCWPIMVEHLTSLFWCLLLPQPPSQQNLFFKKEFVDSLVLFRRHSPSSHLTNKKTWCKMCYMKHIQCAWCNGRCDCIGEALQCMWHPKFERFPFSFIFSQGCV